MRTRPRRQGTPEQRRAEREQRRATNRLEFVRTRAQRTSSGHQRVVIACNAALAASRRITDNARNQLARAIAEAVQAFDIPTNRKERS